MKTLRQTISIDNTTLDLKEGQIIFYKTSGIFGMVYSVTNRHMEVMWYDDNWKSKGRYTWENIHKEIAKSLLDDCFLCENEQDKLFVSLKYGTKE